MKMYLDDLRTPIEEFDFVVRSYDEAVAVMKKHGIPEFISFDQDKLLKTGHDLAKWLVENDLNATFHLSRNFSFKVHSQNPAGKENIISLLIKHKSIDKES